jgi:predicted Fe-Mo cluster-binding NifX family protein
MRIAVATLKKRETSQISVQAGRAPYYLIFNENFELLETVSNPFKRGGGGAGFGVVKMLADKKVDTVIAGGFGKNMIETLTERGIKYLEATGDVKKALLQIGRE